MPEINSPVPVAGSPYPEHDKLDRIKDQSQTCGEFLEWLIGEKKVVLYHEHEHSDGCYHSGGEFLRCGLDEGQFVAESINIERILGEYFGIDPEKLSREKDAMLAEIRRRQEVHHA